MRVSLLGLLARHPTALVLGTFGVFAGLLVAVNAILIPAKRKSLEQKATNACFDVARQDEEHGSFSAYDELFDGYQKCLCGELRQTAIEMAERDGVNATQIVAMALNATEPLDYLGISLGDLDYCINTAMTPLLSAIVGVCTIVGAICCYFIWSSGRLVTSEKHEGKKEAAISCRLGCAYHVLAQFGVALSDAQKQQGEHGATTFAAGKMLRRSGHLALACVRPARYNCDVDKTWLRQATPWRSAQ